MNKMKRMILILFYLLYSSFNIYSLITANNYLGQQDAATMYNSLMHIQYVIFHPHVVKVIIVLIIVKTFQSFVALLVGSQLFSSPCHQSFRNFKSRQQLQDGACKFQHLNYAHLHHHIYLKFSPVRLNLIF